MRGTAQQVQICVYLFTEPANGGQSLYICQSDRLGEPFELLQKFITTIEIPLEPPAPPAPPTEETPNA